MSFTLTVLGFGQVRDFLNPVLQFLYTILPVGWVQGSLHFILSCDRDKFVIISFLCLALLRIIEVLPVGHDSARVYPALLAGDV